MKTSLSTAVALLASLVLSSQAAAQTVQLPTFRFFTTTGTVLVPDRGGTFQGGIKRASSGRTSQGVPIAGKVPFLGRGFRNTGIGRTVGSSGTQVRVTIIDHAEMDRQLLAQPTAYSRRAAMRPSATDVKAAHLARNIGRGVNLSNRRARAIDSEPTESLADIRRKNAPAADERAAEARDFFSRGRRAESEGKHGVAKIYYQMAARRASGELKTQIAVRLNAVSNPSSRIASRGK